VLPGNAGLDLTVTRIYSSQVYPDYEHNSSTAFEGKASPWPVWATS